MKIEESRNSRLEQLSALVKAHCGSLYLSNDWRTGVKFNKSLLFTPGGPAILQISGAGGDDLDAKEDAWLFHDGEWDDLDIHVLHPDYLERTKSLATAYEQLSHKQVTVIKQCA